MEEDDNKHLEEQSHVIEIKPKRLKQFVIVKEYNGSFSPQKKTKREYTQKTILKERLSKPERDSLNFLDRNDKDLKYVTLVDLPPINNNNGNNGNDDYQQKTLSRLSTYEALQKGAFVSLLAVGGLVGAYTIFKNKGE